MKVLEYGELSANTVLLQPVGEHELEALEKEFSMIGRGSGKTLCLAAFMVEDWNRELSPWKASAVFRKEDFGDGAESTLMEILRYCEDESKTYYIGGYSLAGLFALWSAYQTDRFEGVAAVSPSMWFPGFDTYMKEQEIKCGNVYLSLGNREEKAHNPVMATVGDKIRAAHTLLKELDVNCSLEWNEGNHFREPEVRMAKGFSWCINK